MRIKAVGDGITSRTIKKNEVKSDKTKDFVIKVDCDVLVWSNNAKTKDSRILR